MKKHCLIILFLFLPFLTNAQGHSESYRKGMEAFEKDDFPKYEYWMAKAYASNPEHDVIAFEFIKALWLNQKSEKARKLASRLIKRRSVMSHQLLTAEFKGLIDESMRQRLDVMRKPIVQSDTAHVLVERDLVPEGIAIDKRTGVKYVGSIEKQKIIRITPDGEVSDFSHAGDSLWCVLGLEVDEKQDVLWAASAFMPDQKTKDSGCSRLSKIDLKTGSELATYRICEDMLNDVTVSGNEVYATGTLTATVYRYDGLKNKLEPWLDLGAHGYRYMNGITIDKVNNKLYVSHETGLIMADLKTAAWQEIIKPDHVSLLGIDGLAHHNGVLICHQKMLNSISYYRLNKTGDAIVDFGVIDANHPAFDSPTTGELGGDGYYYYLANTQIKSAYAAPYKVRPYLELKDKLIFKWKIKGY